MLDAVTRKEESTIDELSTLSAKLDEAFEETERRSAVTLSDLELALPLLETLNRWKLEVEPPMERSKSLPKH